MPRVFFKDVDKGFANYIKNMKKTPKGHVRIGIQGAKALETKKSKGAQDSQIIDVNIVSVATFNEFGTPTIPERSFLRATIDKNRKEIGNIIEAALIDEKQGKLDKKTTLSLLGLWVQTKIIERIDAGIAPANAPKTIAQKKSSRPLVDTGQLVQSITYVVDLGTSKRKE